MDLDNAWTKIKKGVRDGAALSLEKIEEYSKIGKLKVEEFATKKKIERNYCDIGQAMYALVETGESQDIFADATIKKAVANIRILKEELNSIEQQIKSIVDESRKSKTATEDVDEVTGV
jgi:predicted transcriptional regulator